MPPKIPAPSISTFKGNAEAARGKLSRLVPTYTPHTIHPLQ
jgi:hypothetical protein